MGNDFTQKKRGNVEQITEFKQKYHEFYLEIIHIGQVARNDEKICQIYSNIKYSVKIWLGLLIYASRVNQKNSRIAMAITLI